MTRDDQVDIMETWFRAHYEDPAERMPYESAEGGYVWLDGGPFDPREELDAEFGGRVPDDVIGELADKLSSEMPDWARVADEDFYEESYWGSVGSNQNAFETFAEAISNIEQLLDSAQPYILQRIVQLLFANAITSLEAYLLDTFANVVLRDKAVLRKFVETNPEFQKRQVRYADILRLTDSVSDEVKSYLAGVMWHNLAKVGHMYTAALDIEFGDFSELGRAVAVRHDIVHRNGKTTEGVKIAIGRDEVRKVVAQVRKLVADVEKQFNEKFPPPDSEF
jgi:hypothetical protein